MDDFQIFVNKIPRSHNNSLCKKETNIKIYLSSMKSS